MLGCKPYGTGLSQPLLAAVEKHNGRQHIHQSASPLELGAILTYRLRMHLSIDPKRR